MKIKNFEVLFTDENSHPRSVYYAGQTVCGVVKFRVSDTISVRGIVLKYKGKSHAKWTDIEGKKIKNYEVYMNERIYLLGSEDSDGFKEDLRVGVHTYNFSFKLRDDLPTSFESNNAYVRYYLVLKIYRRAFSKKEYKFKQPITVLTVVDLNNKPESLEPGNSTDTYTLGCCCYQEGPIRSEFKIGRTGYVPGESIVIDGEIDNTTSKEMTETRVELWMKLKLKSKSGKKSKTMKLAELKHGPTSPGGQDIWSQEKFQIPPCPPTMLEVCKVIEITYYLNILGNIGFRGVFHAIPIVMGSVPLKNTHSMPADNWGFMPTTSVSSLSPLSSPAVVDPADISLSPITSQPGALPSASPPSYVNSLQFTGTIVTKNDKLEDGKEDEFNPTYLYFNFETSAQPM